jgi:hypothetical protein
MTDARVALLARLIDHAPLFPPASMSLPDALAEDRRARDDAAAFMLARFVCPASRVGELGDEPRPLSVVLDAPPPDDPRVEALETTALDVVAPALETYVELPVDEALEPRLDELVGRGAYAKVRCGGKATPTVEELARFVRACRERRLPFKATAGLHHAIRRDRPASDRLSLAEEGGAGTPTGGRGSPVGREHGFLNLLAAVVFGNEEAALADPDAAAFSLTSERFAWRDRHAGPAELVAARRRLRSIGSCSFFEPVDELTELGILPL